MKQRSERGGLIHYRRSLPSTIQVIARMIAAFACGLLLTFLLAPVLQKNSFGWSLSLLTILILLIPFLLGIFVPFTIDRQNRHLVLLSLATGLFLFLGVYAYFFPLAVQSDYQIVNVYHHGIAIAVYMLTLYILCAFLLVSLSSLVTALIIKGITKSRRRMEFERLVDRDKG